MTSDSSSGSDESEKLYRAMQEARDRRAKADLEVIAAELAWVGITPESEGSTEIYEAQVDDYRRAQEEPSWTGSALIGVMLTTLIVVFLMAVVSAPPDPDFAPDAVSKIDLGRELKGALWVAGSVWIVLGFIWLIKR